jgi:hypothetical protein
MTDRFAVRGLAGAIRAVIVVRHQQVTMSPAHESKRDPRRAEGGSVGAFDGRRHSENILSVVGYRGGSALATPAVKSDPRLTDPAHSAAAAIRRDRGRAVAR